jgi:hypothetical protein
VREESQQESPETLANLVAQKQKDAEESIKKDMFVREKKHFDYVPRFASPHHFPSRSLLALFTPFSPPSHPPYHPLLTLFSLCYSHYLIALFSLSYSVILTIFSLFSRSILILISFEYLDFCIQICNYLFQAIRKYAEV